MSNLPYSTKLPQIEQAQGEQEVETLVLDTWSYVLLELALISPCGWIFLVEQDGDDFLTALILYILITLILLPMIIMYRLDLELSFFLYNKLHHIPHQTNRGFLYLYMVFFAVLGSYYLASHTGTDLVQIPMEKKEIFFAAALCVYSFILPVFEEWFWRIFARKLFNPHKTQARQMILAFHQAAMFSLLVFNLGSSLISSIAVIMFFIMANRFFQFVHDTEGPVVSLLAAIGLNIAISIIIIDILINEQTSKQEKNWINGSQ